MSHSRYCSFDLFTIDHAMNMADVSVWSALEYVVKPFFEGKTKTVYRQIYRENMSSNTPKKRHVALGDTWHPTMYSIAVFIIVASFNMDVEYILACLRWTVKRFCL